MKRCSFCAEEIQDAAIVCKHCGRDLGAAHPPSARPTGEPKRSRITRSRVFAFLVVVVLGWAVLGNQSNRRDLAAAVQTPITVKDVVDNVPASSWKAVALNLPYSGNLEVSLEVVRGNPLNVLLVASGEMDLVKNDDWSKVRSYTAFDAVKTKTLRRSSQLAAGNYYLVMHDTSLGILSSSASDVALKVRLEP